MQSRLKWVDIYKGLAIILVVVGHAKAFDLFVYTFHVPAFFFISGYTTELDKYTFIEFTRRRLQALMLPYFVVNLIFLLYYAVIQHVPPLGAKLASQHFGLIAGLKQLFFALLAPTDLAGATWFLLVLFLASCLIKLAWDLFGGFRYKQVAMALFAGATMLTGLYLAHEKLFLLYMLDLTYIAVGFIYLGVLFRRLRVFETKIRHTAAAPIAVGILAYYVLFSWAGMDFPSRSFSPPLAIMLGSLSGIYLLYLASLLLSKTLLSQPLEGVGRNSLAILCFHFLGFKPAFWALGKLHAVPTGQLGQLLPIVNSAWYWPIVVISGIGFSVSLAWLIRRNDWLNFLILGATPPVVLEPRT